jgi:transcriptional regulator with XRE-family HTH domain
MANVSPTLRRRELAAQLRRLRRQSGLTVEQVAERLLASTAKISRLETGQRGASLRDVRDLCDIYGVDDATRERLMSLARQSKERSWWQEVDPHLPAQYSTYIGLEEAASSIKEFESGLVPGLLQIEEYARHMIRDSWIPKLRPDVVEQRVEARLKRQAVLTQERGLRFWVVMDEAALHRQVGGPQVMSKQLKRLLTDAELPTLTLQVLPYDVGAYPGLNSTFILLEFAEAGMSSVVYVESMIGQMFLERPHDVERYSQTFDHLRAMALSPAASTGLIASLSQELGA